MVRKSQTPRSRWGLKLSDNANYLCPPTFALSWPHPYYLCVLTELELLIVPTYGNPYKGSGFLSFADEIRFSIGDLPGKADDDVKLQEDSTTLKTNDSNLTPEFKRERTKRKRRVLIKEESE